MNIFTITDASNFLNYKQYTIRHFVKAGKLRAYRHGKYGQLRFKRKDLENFLEEVNPSVDTFLKKTKKTTKQK